MRDKIGTSTIYTTIIPNFKELYRVYPRKLSREAKLRLKVLEYYYKKADKNATRTARYFGVSRNFVYKWVKRCYRWDLSTLESRSRRPKRTRAVQYDMEVVGIIRKIRRDYPTFSAVKISVLLLRDYGIRISSATVGRIIKRFNLFFAKLVQAKYAHSRAAKRSWQSRKVKERMKYYMKAEKPRHIIEFDMKHIDNCSGRQYALCAIDVYTKEALIYISSTSSAKQASIAMQKVLDHFGKDIILVCDNGSENFGATYDLLEEAKVRQVFARPHTPKDKPHIENFIGKYQKECLDESKGERMSVAERQEEADRWLRDWHYYRPHQALNYMTPAEYCATIGITI